MEYLTFGPALHRRRREFLNDLRTARSVLILGDGDGRFTAELLRYNTSATVHSLDGSAAMTRLAAARIAKIPNGASRVCQVVEDARTAQLAGRYDLVVTHFFLDCFTTEELEALVAQVTPHVDLGGRWVISEFHVPTSGFRKILATLVVKLLYAGFRILTGLTTKQLPDYRQTLRRHGYRRTAFRTGVADMLVSEIWELAR